MKDIYGSVGGRIQKMTQGANHINALATGIHAPLYAAVWVWIITTDTVCLKTPNTTWHSSPDWSDWHTLTSLDRYQNLPVNITFLDSDLPLIDAIGTKWRRRTLSKNFKDWYAPMCYEFSPLRLYTDFFNTQVCIHILIPCIRDRVLFLPD